jgi:uncharacterized RmlC-like cupin family protein
MIHHAGVRGRPGIGPRIPHQKLRENEMRVPTLALVAAIAASLPAWADSSTMDLLTGSDAVKWGPGPSGLPKGTMIAVISGDPSKDGPSVVRLKLPANYQIPAHHHSKVENITVLSGSFHAGMGDKLDAKKGEELLPGGFMTLPPDMNHYAWTSAETVIQVHGPGPVDIIYVNPTDDPRKTQ